MPEGREEHSFVTLAGHELYIAYHAPADAPRAGVVFCLPIHEEQKSGYRPFVDAARTAAEAGCACARFHYAGTADSSGDPLELSVESMARDTVVVANHLRELSSVESVHLVGLRLGAAVALIAAEDMGSCAGVLLIEPVQDGAMYLRRAMQRKNIRKMVTQAEGEAAGSTAATPSEAVEDEDTFDFDGHLIGPVLQESLGAMKLLERTTSLGCHVKLLEIAGREKLSRAGERLIEGLRERGVEPEQQTIVAEPFWNSLGVIELPEVTQAIVEFVT